MARANAVLLGIVLYCAKQPGRNGAQFSERPCRQRLPRSRQPRGTLTDWGFYSQVLYGFRKGWVAGLRGDYVGRTSRANYEGVYGNDTDRLDRWRISPNLTWYPSEFSKIRLQYNYDDRRGIGVDHSIWLQFEFLLGAHAAHKF